MWSYKINWLVLTDYLWRICSLCAHRSPLTYEGNLMMVWSWIVEPCLNWPFALADASQMNHLTVKELLWKFLMCIRLNSVDPVMQRSSLVGVLDLSGGSLRTLLPKQREEPRRKKLECSLQCLGN
ncbi:hypothetical protein MKW98_013854 [Papaver atlanticum]|uniref:Uncharacterized protein n=1 Tax=Papaver atlanticum TaxID=357466 RepID=A0AAD4TEX5_9MAGN|nr:hypothetical protein MKW98_013854 [Papaver atlanticum]